MIIFYYELKNILVGMLGTTLSCQYCEVEQMPNTCAYSNC